MASVAHATTKARKTNQMTASSQRSALDKALRAEPGFPSPASAGRGPVSDTRAESGSIVMPRLRALLERRQVLRGDIAEHLGVAAARLQAARGARAAEWRAASRSGSRFVAA